MEREEIGVYAVAVLFIAMFIVVFVILPVVGPFDVSGR
jgi:hypothetical protein